MMMGYFFDGPMWLAIVLVVVFCGLFAVCLAWLVARKQESFSTLLLTLFAFALLGMAVGQITGQSRDPAVNSVVPALLTLVGGIGVFIISKGDQATHKVVSLLIVSLTMNFLIGVGFGSLLREANTRHFTDLDYLLLQEQKKYTIELQKQIYEKRIKDQRKRLGLPEKPTEKPPSYE